MKKASYHFGLCAGLLLGATSAWAHHAFSAEFDSNKPMTLRGTLTKMELSNPHGWLYIDVAAPDATVVNWAVETGPTNALIRRGLRTSDFVPGSEVVVSGFQAKNGATMLNGAEIKFADGRILNLSPNGVRLGTADKDKTDKDK
jgi:hypothetical protein